MATSQWSIDGRVLVLDNEIPYQLRLLGVACRATPSCHHALRLVEQDPQIKTVLIADRKSRRDLADFVCAAKSLRAELVFVGVSSRDHRREFAALGVDRFLQEPWSISDLIDILTPPNFPDMKASDTRIGKADSQTDLMRFRARERVRISCGILKGCEGVVVGPRAHGRILIERQPGVFVEIDQYAVERVE